MDQTPAIVGLAAGLSVGVVLIVILAVCIYYQNQRLRNRPSNQNPSYVTKNYADNFSASNKQPTNVQQTESTDVNPETGQQLPVAFEVQQGIPFTPPQPTSLVSPIFLQPSLAYNSSAVTSNQLATRLYPSAENGHPYGNDALMPGRALPPPRFKNVGFRRHAEWFGPAPQLQQPINAFHLHNPLSRPPVVEHEFTSENVIPLGSNVREAFSDGEEIERLKKNKKLKVRVVKVDKLNKKRSRHHSDTSSSSSESESGSDDGSSLDSSSESVKKLKILKPGVGSIYYLEDGEKGNKKGKKKRKRKLIAMIPPAPIPQPTPPQPLPCPPPEPPAPQPMVFILPGNNQQQVEPAPRIQEYELRPVSVPAKNSGAAFWAADGAKKPALFKAGGRIRSSEYETQERAAQLEDDVELSQKRINIQISGNIVGDGVYSGGGFASGGFSSGGYVNGDAGNNGSGCRSCESGGSSGFGATGGGVYSMGGDYRAVGAVHGSNYGGIERQVTTQHGNGYEENGYSINF